HGIEVSQETVRGWMVAARLCKAQPHELVEHFWRPRRRACGELVQRETSNNDWPRGRGAVVRCLVKWIDDATSRSGRRFAQHDGTRENMGVPWQYVKGNGRMVDLYTDRAGVFMVTPRAKESAQQVKAGVRGKILRNRTKSERYAPCGVRGQYEDVGECGVKAPLAAKAAGKE